ncbi:MAG: ATP-binding cassette domain-containing protein [Bacilli bacterium]|nr:ATP-binding cassette domain-containing protein [Bacilli bacterium]
MLSIVNLTKIYKTKGGNDTKALDNVTLDFPETGMIFLLGKSGSGKSTLLNLIGGLDFPTSGEIILKGRSSKDFSQSDFDSYRNTYIGFVFQEYNILNEFNVEQNIALAIELQNKKVKEEEVQSLLEQVDLKDFAKRKPNTLSGGQKQRIAIARALIKQPNIIMADEPTGALDSKTGEQVFETLKKLSKDKLVIVVSHDRDFAERFGDRIIELKDGQVISDETKHYVESKEISSNVSIINDHAIKINDAKKLTKSDFDKLYESIKKSDGKVFISSGENADKSMKIARISEDGKSDEFKATEDVEVKEYDGSKTTFIRSKMPMGKSVKMGLSSLKTKPVRLIFTMLLSVVSFSMFGVASSLMLYNSSHTYAEALRRTDYKAEALQKSSVGNYVYQETDAAGNVVREGKSADSRQVLFGEEEVKRIGSNNLGLVYIPVNETGTVAFNGITLKKNAEYYSTYYKLRFVSDASKEEFNKLGYSLIGQYPVNDDEIILPKIYGQMMIDGQGTTKTNIDELVGEKFTVNSYNKGLIKLTVTGFFDAGDVPSTYNDLTSETAALSPDEQIKLANNLKAYIDDSFNCVFFTNSETYKKFARPASESIYVETYNRRGADINAYGKPSDVNQEMYITVLTDELYKQQSSAIKLYDLDGNAVTKNSFTLKDDEAYMPIDQFENQAYSIRNNFLSDFIQISLSSSIMKYMPAYYDFYKENPDEIGELKSNSYEYADIILELFKSFKDEFRKAYAIDRFVDRYTETASFDALSSSNKSLINEVKSAAAGANTSTKVNQVYGLLCEHFDDANGKPNYILKSYFDDTYNSKKENRILIEADPTLNELRDKGAETWTTSEVNAVKDFLNEHCADGISNNPYWNNYLAGYTFAEYTVPQEKVLQPRSDLVYNWGSYNGTTGELKIIGYYECGEYGYGPLVTKSFIDSISLTASYDGGNTYTSHYETDYVAPTDAKYSNVMVKSEFTFEQVEYMRKSNDPTFTYELTSPRFVAAAEVVFMINLLKTIFLWVGVGFGVFAGLMLLNFITVSISSKKKDIGILRAIGARKGDVFKIFFSESLFIAAICAALAIIITFVAQFFLDRYFVQQIDISILQFNPLTLLLIIGVALVVAFVATIIPVMHSSRKPPVESIRAL